jgi:hypothetical protein
VKEGTGETWEVVVLFRLCLIFTFFWWHWGLNLASHLLGRHSTT